MEWAKTSRASTQQLDLDSAFELALLHMSLELFSDAGPAIETIEVFISR